MTTPIDRLVTRARSLRNRIGVAVARITPGWVNALLRIIEIIIELFGG